MGWLTEICEQGRPSGAPFPSHPVHEVHKQTLESCYYATTSNPFPNTLSMFGNIFQSVVEFGVKGA